MSILPFWPHSPRLFAASKRGLIPAEKLLQDILWSRLASYTFLTSKCLAKNALMELMALLWGFIGHVCGFLGIYSYQRVTINIPPSPISDTDLWAGSWDGGPQNLDKTCHWHSGDRKVPKCSSKVCISLYLQPWTIMNHLVFVGYPLVPTSTHAPP